jgi:hypothetical protein
VSLGMIHHDQRLVSRTVQPLERGDQLHLQLWTNKNTFIFFPASLTCLTNFSPSQ